MSLLRKTSAGILRNQAETAHLDQLADTAKALPPEASRALAENAASRSNRHYSTVRNN